MRVMVAGSRDWTDEDKVYTVLDRLLERHLEQGGDEFEVLHGGARGADSFGFYWAMDRSPDASQQVFLPDYAKHGSRAPHVRNDAMLDRADYLVAFWDGKSRGTKSVIDKAAKRGLDFEVHSPAGVYVEV